MKRNDIAVFFTILGAAMLVLMVFGVPVKAEQLYVQDGEHVTFDEIEAVIDQADLTTRELSRGKVTFPEGVVQWDDDATTPTVTGNLLDMKNHTERTTGTWQVLNKRIADAQEKLAEVQGIWDSQQTFLPKAEVAVQAVADVLQTVTPTPTPAATVTPTPTP